MFITSTFQMADVHGTAQRCNGKRNGGYPTTFVQKATYILDYIYRKNIKVSPLCTKRSFGSVQNYKRK